MKNTKKLPVFLMFLVCIGTVLAKGSPALPGTEKLFTPVDDPLETYNRGVETFNKYAVRHLVYPLGTAYNALIPQCVRTGIDNFGRNCLYPLRLVNCALQGKGQACWTETKRFAVNTTVGVLGLMDPATGWGIPLELEDFGQTLAVYGMGDGCYINWPFLGPSSAKNTLGFLLDLPFSPLFWITSDPVRITANSTISFNQAAGNAGLLYEFFNTNAQTYPLTKALYFQRRQTLDSDAVLPRMTASPDPDQALNFLFFAPRDQDAIAQRRQVSANLDGSHRMPYACWPRRNRTSLEQKQNRGLMVLLPGIGGSHMSSSTAALAEIFCQEGWSCIALSSTFTPDYIGNLPECIPPGYFPKDAELLNKVLKKVIADFRSRFPKADPQRQPVSIVGYSLGAINTLYLAAEAVKHPDSALPVRRYLAINPPIDILEALQTIDSYCDIPLKWPEATREQQALELYHRLGLILQRSAYLRANNLPIPLTREESQFLIGLNMRLQLTQLLYSCAEQFALPQSKNYRSKGNDLWRKTLKISFSDYMKDYVFAFYRQKNSSCRLEAMQKASSLTSLSSHLGGNDKVWVFQNQNDFLVSPASLPWYQQVLAARAVLFPEGSHLGNLMLEAYQNKMLEVMK